MIEEREREKNGTLGEEGMDETKGVLTSKRMDGLGSQERRLAGGAIVLILTC